MSEIPETSRLMIPFAAEDLYLINTLNEAVNRGDSLADIIDIITRETIKTFSSNGVTIYLVDEERKHLVLQKIPHSFLKIDMIEKLIGIKIPSVKIPLTEESVYNKTLKGGKPVLISDKETIIEMTKEHTDNNFLKKMAPKVMDILGVQHTIVAPVTSEGIPFGVLTVSKKDAFKKSDIERLEFLANYFLTILKRKILEDALKESEEHYRILAETAHDIIFVINNKYEVTYVNKIGLKLLNQGRGEIIGKKVIELFPNDTGKNFMASLQEIVLTGKPLNAQNLSAFPNNVEIWLDTSLVPRKDRNNKVTEIMGTSRDITERKNAEKEKEEMRDRLFEAEKMKAIGILTGGIAHDINNMLTAINGFSCVALENTDDKQSVQDCLNQVCQVVQRANQLTRKLLGFSRRHPDEFKEVSVNTIIDDLKKLLLSFIRNGVTITFNLKPDVNPVHADAFKIEQVIMNLVMNAKDALQESGEITISTENILLKKKDIKSIPDGKPGEYACISVKDSGAGIDQELVDKIFEPFFTTKAEDKGTGLGLTVVNDIIKQHRGFIKVESRVGKETIFKVYLPAIKQ